MTTNPYTLPPVSYESSTSIRSAPTSSFYTLKMYEASTESHSGAACSKTTTGYFTPQEVHYHPTDGSAGSSAGITFTNPFVPSEPNDACPRSYSSSSVNGCSSPVLLQSTNVSNNIANSGATFQPLYATFGAEPVFVSCPYCQHTDETITEPVIGMRSVLCCIILPIFGLLFKSKWDTRHKCKCCLNVIGVHYAQ